jgi:hypothetical protein
MPFKSRNFGGVHKNAKQDHVIIANHTYSNFYGPTCRNLRPESGLAGSHRCDAMYFVCRRSRGSITDSMRPSTVSVTEFSKHLLSASKNRKPFESRREFKPLVQSSLCWFRYASKRRYEQYLSTPKDTAAFKVPDGKSTGVLTVSPACVCS